MNKSHLFNEFEKISATAWKQKIQVDLDGDDYNEKLLWKTNEGIVVKPFYTTEDKTGIATEPLNHEFYICQTIFVDDEKIANRIAINAIKAGATAIQFKADKIFNYQKLLENITLNNIVLYFKFNFLDTSFKKEIANHLGNKTFFFQTDIIGNLAESGNWFTSLKDDFYQLNNFQKKVDNSISISGDLYQESGATITQQLAYTLAHANEYLHNFGSKCYKNIHFCFSVSGNYFFEIAKLKAFKILWQHLLEAYDIKVVDPHFFVKPSIRNKTIYDNNTNIIRTTTECMSAILGGANTVANICYDGAYNKSNEFSERIARNQLLILKEESYFKEFQNFTEGAYYVESLIEQLAESALAIFKQIEKSGGFLKQLKNGAIQKKIKENATKEEQNILKNENILLGVNTQQNAEDTIHKQIKLYPFVKQRNIKTLIPPLIRKRLSESVEKQRLDDEINNF